MTSQLSRVEIYRQVRVVLVRHLIDLGRLTIRISLNHLILYGSLLRLPGCTAKLTPMIVMAIFSELSQVPGIKRVDADLENWRRDDRFGAWHPFDKSAQPEAVRESSKEITPEVFDVADDNKDATPPSA